MLRLRLGDFDFVELCGSDRVQDSDDRRLVLVDWEGGNRQVSSQRRGTRSGETMPVPKSKGFFPGRWRGFVKNIFPQQEPGCP